MLLRGGVPESDVVDYVADAEQPITGTEHFDAVIVAHERLVELGGGFERI